MLELDGLTKTYAGFEFGPVDATVGDEVLAVLGPSGSGKTTLLSVIAGIVAPDSGSVSLNGRALSGRSLEDRRTGLVFQDGALFPHLTAHENIGYAATSDDRIDELATLLEIRDVLDRRPATLSGGEKQRVALARTLAADPDALLLDEPLSSLDAPIRRRLRSELHALFDSLDIPVVYVTHDQRTATALGDRIAIFRNGTIEQIGPPSTVLREPETRFVATFTGNENLFEGVATGDATVRVGDVELRTSEPVPAESAVTVCLHPSRIRLCDPSARPADGSAVPPTNVIRGTVDDWLNEGTEYRVHVNAAETSLALVTTARPPAFDRLAIDAGAPIQVAIPPQAVHLIPTAEAGF
ncbi:ABC transporter ATP-binding protein [Halobellus sp. Atlit-38R]|uniref:ABC transporter ATP-binding protein n=1 Tax=Halobellus sp. Atlit-38R TaxID=2282131 RepID=UPI000EF2467D|nr:ABC transporter ATP-binding protein [Halobellus sp. Atlit-38R]RLM88067.1 ABC transporter ATP-binding protein [Halobellus sp. Atlit-38R]